MEPVQGRRITASALLMALVAVGALGVLACAQKDQLISSGPIPSSPEELLTQLKENKTHIDQATDQMMKRIDAFNASRQPGERTLQFSEIFNEDLSPEQRDILNTLVQQEKDVSYKALLQKIIADRDNIRGLQEKVMHLEQSLPDKFVVAKKGDSQHKMALAYLTDEAKVDPADELLAGNKVWFFYDPKDDTFRTYVTQGEARQTPLAVRRALKRQLISERDAAQAEVESLQRTKADLEATKTGLESDIAGLRQNKAELESNVDRLSRDLAFRQNSLFYHAANTHELKESGVLSSALKRF